MGTQHIYYDDEASVIKTKTELLALRESNDEDAKKRLINQYEDPRGKRKQNIAQKVLYDTLLDEALLDTLAKSVSITERLRSDYAGKPFEGSLRAEMSRRDMQLSHADAYMKKQGYDTFNAKDLFIKIGIGNGRLLFSNPVILPFHAPEEICHTHDRPNPDKKLVTPSRQN